MRAHDHHHSDRLQANATFTAESGTHHLSLVHRRIRHGHDCATLLCDAAPHPKDSSSLYGTRTGTREGGKMTQHRVVGSGQAANARKCPKCGSTLTVALSGMTKCNACGNQFDQERPLGVPFVIPSPKNYPRS
jgi:ribosomal protein L37AE/L43A